MELRAEAQIFPKAKDLVKDALLWVAFGLVDVLAELNWRIHYDDSKANEDLLRASLAEGWTDRERPDVEKATEEQATEMFRRREVVYETLKADMTGEGLVKRQVWEGLYCDEKGRVLRPVFIANNSYRRITKRYFESQVFRFRGDGKEMEPRPILPNIPICFRVFASERERFENHIRENTDRNKGNKALDMSEMYRAAYDGVRRLSYIQSDLRRIFGVGTGQKLYELVQLSRSAPGEVLGMHEMIEKGELDLGKFNKESLRDLRKSLEDGSLSEDQLEDVLNKVRKGERQKRETLTDKVLKEIVRNTGSKSRVAPILSVVLSGNKEGFAQFVDQEVVDSTTQSAYDLWHTTPYWTRYVDGVRKVFEEIKADAIKASLPKVPENTEVEVESK